MIRKCFTHGLEFDNKEKFEQHLREVEHEYETDSICQRCNSDVRVKKIIKAKLGQKEKFPKVYCSTCWPEIKKERNAKSKTK